MRKKIWNTLAILIFIGCSSSKDDFIKETANGCMYSVSENDADVLCKCYAAYISEQFTDQELDLIMKLKGRRHQTLKEARMQYSIKERLDKYTNFINVSADEVEDIKNYIKKCIEK